MNLNPVKESISSKDLIGPAAFNRFGIYDGIVEYNADPLQLGRVIVRVPLIHKEEYGVDMLPWARPCSPFGGGPGYGTYMIPPIGSRIWVMFESGNELYPVWLGTWVSNPVKDRKMLRDSLNEYPKGPSAMAPKPGTPWTSPAAPGLPKEAQGQVANRPEIYVPFKSPKGAALIVDDRDGKESFSILDRLGQGLTFEGPVSVGANYNNASGRSFQTAKDGKSIPIGRTQNKEGKVLLTDVGGQSIELSSKLGDFDLDGSTNWAGRIRLSSRQPLRNQTGEVKSGPIETEGQNAVILDLSGSDNTVNLSMSIEGKIVTSISIDANAGTIVVDTPNNIVLKSDHIKLDGDVTVTGDLKTESLQVDKNAIVSGKLVN
jgi:hypothetical protein